MGEVQTALNRGIQLQGICFYPLITSPDWEDPTAFFNGGLFDVIPEMNGQLRRVISVPVALALREAQALVDPANLPAVALEPLPSFYPEPNLQGVRPSTQVRFKPDNFSYQTVFATDGLVLELYGFETGASIAPHQHESTEHVLTVVRGQANIRVGSQHFTLQEGESALVPAGMAHGIPNINTERLIVQQLSTPKPWDARFNGPHPLHNPIITFPSFGGL